jgi:hypothetical protein
MHHAFALMPPESELTLAAVKDRLKITFPEATVALKGGEITITEGDWDYHLVLQKGPEILEESEGFAGRISGLDDDSSLRACDRRIEVWSETPDPFMEYFEKHFQVLGVLREFKGVILVDPSEPSLL